VEREKMTTWNPIAIKTPEDIKPDFEFDLKGEICPYTFVKSKLALEMLDSGQILQVVVDNDESATNVPKSLTNEGNSVLGVEKVNGNDWLITVRKK
jgi:tRNA 2-thiouridine synthesizing protein A